MYSLATEGGLSGNLSPSNEARINLDGSSPLRIRLKGNKMTSSLIASGENDTCLPCPGRRAGGTTAVNLQDSSSGCGLARRMTGLMVVVSEQILRGQPPTATHRYACGHRCGYGGPGWGRNSAGTTRETSQSPTGSAGPKAASGAPNTRLAGTLDSVSEQAWEYCGWYLQGLHLHKRKPQPQSGEVTYALRER